MAIAFDQYVDITSGVGAQTFVTNRSLTGRIFTTNTLLPTGSFKEFTSAADVGVYFGTTSVEYLRALFYFSFISKNVTSAPLLSFGRWVNAPTAAMIFGGALIETLTQFNTITTGAFALDIGGVTNQITGLDFSAAGSLAAVAAIIQAAICTQTGAQWTGATVTYDATRSGFDLVTGSAIAATISVASPISGTDITAIIAWVPSSGAIWSNGSLAETITTTLTNSDAASDNFGSFLFMPTLTISQNVEAATWNQSLNFKYMFNVVVTPANAVAWQAALDLIGGVSLTIQSPVSGEFPEQFPMMIEAATDYTARNSTQNYMYQQTNLTPSVTDTPTAQSYDAISVNYYGQTQQAGQLISFYQRGVLQGPSTSALDMNTYANEQWLKDAAGVAIMQLLLALPKISANTQGRIQIMGALQSVINQGLFNGTISVGKQLNTTQQLFIGVISGSAKAWYQVQNSGYWLDCTITLVGLNYIATYTLIYSKDDVIRKVEGTHILI